MNLFKRPLSGIQLVLSLAMLQFAMGLIALYLVEFHFDLLAGPPRQVTNLNDAMLLMMKEAHSGEFYETARLRELASRIKKMGGVSVEAMTDPPVCLLVRHTGIDSNLVWVVTGDITKWESPFFIVHESKVRDFLQRELKRRGPYRADAPLPPHRSRGC